MTNPDETAPMLPGLEPPAEQPGDGLTVEAAMRQQLTKLRELGYIEDHHAGLVLLAITTARDIDRSQTKGMPSGRANLYRVMNEILERIPQPEAASKDALDSVLDAIRHDDDADEVIVYADGVRPSA